MITISKLTKITIISIILFIISLINNSNIAYGASLPSFTKEDLINAVANVYEAAHNGGWKYGSSSTLPPCEAEPGRNDMFGNYSGQTVHYISCDRLISRALYDLGITDQVRGGQALNSMRNGFLEEHGFFKKTDPSETKAGDIVIVTGHVFFVVDYDPTTGLCSKYDFGAQSRIDSQQPFTGVPLNEWNNRQIEGIYEWGNGANNSYKIQQIKSLVNFKTVSKNGEPDKYDVMVKAEDLKGDIEIPGIRASLESVIYEDNPIFNIDFFGVNNQNEEEEDIVYGEDYIPPETSSRTKTLSGTYLLRANNTREYISNRVKGFLYSFLYIAVISLVVLLLFIAIIVIVSKMSTRLNDKIVSNINGNFFSRSILGIFIEEWIRSFALIILVVFIINIIIGIYGIIKNKIIENVEDENKYVIYLKVGEGTVNATTFLPNDLSNLQAKDLIPYGKIAYNYSSPNISEGANERQYIIDVAAKLVSAAHLKFPMKKSLVIAQIINESGWISLDAPIVSQYNNILGINNYSALTSPETTWYKNGARTVNLSMPHGGGSTIDPAKAYSNLYECIEDYMGQFIYHHPASSFGSYDDMANYERYIHGYTPTSDAGQDMFVFYKGVIDRYSLAKYDTMPDEELSGAFSSKLESCYFTTNIEGLFMFLSQYDWNESDNLPQNGICLFASLVLAIFKYFLYVILLLRTIILAILIATSPLIIIYNAVRKILGEKGVLLKYGKFSLFLMFLQPLIALVYSVLMTMGSGDRMKSPLYIFLVILIMVIIICFYLKKMYEEFSKIRD